MQIANAGDAIVTDGVDLLDINLLQGGGTNYTNAGIHVTIAGSGNTGDVVTGLLVTATGATNNTQYGIDISGITPAGGPETAINIGAGWDTGINLNANIIANIGNAGTDFDTGGGLTLAADLAVNGDDITSDGTALKIEVGGTSTTAIIQIGAGGRCSQ